MSYFEPSNYETSDNIMANTGRKKGSLLCFGLPLGSGVVLIALINSVCTYIKKQLKRSFFAW